VATFLRRTNCESVATFVSIILVNSRLRIVPTSSLAVATAPDSFTLSGIFCEGTDDVAVVESCFACACASEFSTSELGRDCFGGAMSLPEEGDSEKSLNVREILRNSK